MSIKISEVEFRQLMTDLNNEINSMESILNDVKKRTLDVPAIWDGDDSQPVVKDIDDFKTQFNDIDEDNRARVEYLKKVIDSYQAAENANIKVVDEGNSSLDINV